MGQNLRVMSHHIVHVPEGRESDFFEWVNGWNGNSPDDPLVVESAIKNGRNFRDEVSLLQAEAKGQGEYMGGDYAAGFDAALDRVLDLLDTPPNG